MCYKIILLTIMFAFLSYGEQSLELDPNQSYLGEPIIVISSSVWQNVAADSPEFKSYQFTMESIVQTGGVRYFVYKNYVFNICSTNSTTNTVYYSPYTEDLKVNNNIYIIKPELPQHVAEILDNLPGLDQAKILDSQPELDKAENGVPVYEDHLQYDKLNLEPYTNLPLFASLSINDPIEGFNRVMFVIDETIFVYFISPIGKVYRFIAPLYFREHLEQVDYNIMMPKRLFNNLFQAKFKGAGITFSRFLINTTVGIAGFWDPARAAFDLHKYDEDTDQTFAKWGIPPGAYLYLPIAGNLSLRGGVGLIFDEAFDPRTYAPFGGMAKTFMKLNNISLDIDDIEQARKEYYDPYSLSRDLWYIMRTQSIDK